MLVITRFDATLGHDAQWHSPACNGNCLLAPPCPHSILLQIAAAKRQLKQDSVDTEWSSSPGNHLHPLAIFCSNLLQIVMLSTKPCKFGPFPARHLTSFENGNSPGLNDHKSAWFSHPMPLCYCVGQLKKPREGWQSNLLSHKPSLEWTNHHEG